MPLRTTTTTTRTVTSSSNVAVHKISFRGIAGGIFILLALSLLIYVIGFATTGWSINGAENVGLWQTCYTNKGLDNRDWFKAVQAMITIGLILLILAFILICVYMTIHSVSKNSTIIAVTVICFVAVLFMLIGFVIWGLKTNNQHYSFTLTVIAAFLTLAAGILAIVQMRQSNVHI